MDNPSIPSPPSNEEKTHFFFGLPTQPVLSARTDCVTLPWTRPLYRILGPVTDVDLVRKWRDAVRSPNGDNNSCGSSVGNIEGNLEDALVDVLTKHKIEWTFYVPFVIHGRPYQDVGWHPVDYTGHPEATEQNTTYLFIGVQKYT
ncbi:hypothetical protein Sste5346_007129 [Sporothrix stenoceras]|uniref:Uncharacterized protein n=1 Tax=Sporothrix stenoceras TaxID=5173 RepID=A0ABR3YWX3_9PEZI